MRCISFYLAFCAFQGAINNLQAKVAVSSRFLRVFLNMFHISINYFLNPHRVILHVICIIVNSLLTPIGGIANT